MTGITREDCRAADATDALAGFREEFLLPPGLIYLDGNSLGPLPRTAPERARRLVTEEWGTGLIGSWNAAGWFDLPRRLGELLSQVIGGGPDSTVVTDTTSTNLFKVLAAALDVARTTDPDGRRTVLVSERDNFPTDLYMAQGIAEFVDRGLELRLVDQPTELADALDDRTAVVLLSHVNYRTGAMWDLAATTALVHAHGGLAVWDLAHSAGAVPVDLVGADADFAVGCTYKYLNGGPGAPAFVWAHPRHAAARQPLTGWWSHARPFAMEPGFDASAGIGRFLCGTQPVVSLALVECGLEIALRADPVEVRRKSLALGDLFVELVGQRCGRHPLELVTPREHARRGSHVSFRHPDGYAVMQALIERGVVGDYREPEVLRFGLTPLYLRYVDVFDAVEVLADVLDRRTFEADRFRTRATVT